MKLGRKVWAGNKALGYVNLNLISKATVIDSVQLLSCVRLFLTPRTASPKASLSITISQSLLKLMSLELLLPSTISSSVIPFSSCLNLSQLRVFSNESVLCIRWWPKYWSFTFSISLSNEHLVLISFRIYWLDLLSVKQTINSLPNTIVQNHQFFSTQLSLWSNSHIHTWLLGKPLIS